MRLFKPAWTCGAAHLPVASLDIRSDAILGKSRDPRAGMGIVLGAFWGPFGETFGIILGTSLGSSLGSFVWGCCVRVPYENPYEIPYDVPYKNSLGFWHFSS